MSARRSRRDPVNPEGAAVGPGSQSRVPPGFVPPERRSPGRILLLLPLLAFVVHLAALTFGGYGWFRDELYYLACSRRLAAGYVDQPPFSIFVLAVARRLLGESVLAVRLVPALLSGVSVLVIGRVVRRLGGGPVAISLASLAFMASPQILGFHAYYSMNSFDILFWLLAALALLRVAERPDLRGWLVLGMVLGLGLLNKTSVLWLCAGIAAAVALAPRLRSTLRTPGPYATAGVALVLFSPFVIWNALHGWPHLEFMRNASAEKYASLTRGRFLLDQLLVMNPFTYLLAVPGLFWSLRSRANGRILGVVFLTVFAILFANPHTKAEYLAAAYPLLYACGGVALERVPRPWSAAGAAVVSGLLVLSGILLAPLAMPILPVEKYIRYSRAIGVGPPGSTENLEVADLPQFFADMHGWEELARDVSNAYLTLPETERPTTVAFVMNYGEAGALEYYARRYPLPRVICNHNAYWRGGRTDPDHDLHPPRGKPRGLPRVLHGGHAGGRAPRRALHALREQPGHLHRAGAEGADREGLGGIQAFRVEERTPALPVRPADACMPVLEVSTWPRTPGRPRPAGKSTEHLA